MCNAPLAPAPVEGKVNEPHTHTTPTGAVVECYHECKSTLSRPAFWVLTTLAFPIEHAIWTKLPLLSGLAKWAGL